MHSSDTGPRVVEVSDLSFLHTREQRDTLLCHARSWSAGWDRSAPVEHDSEVSFEAFLVRPDILRRHDTDGLVLYHVVPAFAPKAYSLDHARMQTIVLRRAGYDVATVRFLCLNKDFDLGSRGHVEPGELFRELRVPKTFERSLAETEAFLERMQKAVKDDTLPARCRRRVSCEICYPDIGEKRSEHHVRTLFRGGGFVDELEKQGYTDLRQLSDDQVPGRRHKLQLQAIRSGLPHIDVSRLRGFLADLRFPRVFLDFETISRAIPPVANVRPWEHVPMQFSAHRQRSPDAPVEQFSYLAAGMSPDSDERCELMQSLVPVLEGCGSVIAYAAAFERRTLLRLADWCPAYTLEIREAVSKIRDLQKPFAEFWYYHPEQHGKTGLKKVLPVMSGAGYERLEVQDGLEASLRWQYEYATDLLGRDESLNYSTGTNRGELRTQLLDYCAQDTRGLIDIVDAIERVLADHN